MFILHVRSNDVIFCNHLLCCFTNLVFKKLIQILIQSVRNFFLIVWRNTPCDQSNLVFVLQLGLLIIFRIFINFTICICFKFKVGFFLMLNVQYFSDNISSIFKDIFLSI
eukprot:NODE_498_length_6794_cov_0.318250.p8 type:complete len:110 gc:universal NODE_498_length_6794_cov_0.318250:6548-6219(-)